MTGDGDLFAYIGAFIIWLIRGFRKKYSDIVEKYYTLSFIVGFVFVILIILCIEKIFSVVL